MTPLSEAPRRSLVRSAIGPWETPGHGILASVAIQLLPDGVPFGICRRWNYVVGHFFLLDVFTGRLGIGGINHVQRVGVVHRHSIHKQAGEAVHIWDDGRTGWAQAAVNLFHVHDPKLADLPITPFYSWSGRPLGTVGPPPL